MQVQDVLDKITERNAPIIGCIARAGDMTHHNLDDYGLACDEIADTVGDLFAVTDLMDDDDQEVTAVLTRFDGHCLVGQRLEDTLLVAVTDHLERSGFKKLQVGLSLQTRMLAKALAEAPAPTPQSPLPETTEAAPLPDAADPSKPGFLSGLFRSKSRTAEAPSQVTNTEGKVRRVYRGQVYWE